LRYLIRVNPLEAVFETIIQCLIRQEYGDKPLIYLIIENLSLSKIWTDEPQLNDEALDENTSFTKKQEFTLFLFLTVFMAPILSFGIVVVYGFIVWMSQIIMGPPGI
jgi:periplasmic nitrate reductase NapE